MNFPKIKIKIFNSKNEENVKAPQPIKIHRKPKTVRKYERVTDVIDFYNVISRHGEKIAFSYFDRDKNVKDITYSEFTSIVKQTAAGFDSFGLNGKRIAIIGETSVEWVSSYLAILATGGVAIPLDKELEISEIEGFLKSVDADAIIYSSHFNGKFNSAKSNHPSLSTFIPLCPEGEESLDAKTVPFEKILASGASSVRHGYEFPKVKDREALAEFLFTSGTTGTSKCVMLSQKNIFSVVSSAAASVDINPDDTIVSVLPIHHTYELACMIAALDYGVHICINDSLTHVIRNFKLFQPTALVLVPLFVYTIYKKIWAEAKKTGQDKKLKIGIGVSRSLMAMGIDKRKEMFKEVTDSFGGRLEKIICGGAALNPKMIEFFENLGISIYEGFGITECAPLTCVTPYYARKYGSVGPAVPCCQTRIEGTITNAYGFIEGEIQVKGENVMLGYYNNPEANENAFTSDGWFRTGDMGYMDGDGYVYITGRLKSVIVLENGKNVFPEEIEEYLGDIEEIAESVVVGRSSGSEKVNLVAIVYPDFSKFPEDADDDSILEKIESLINNMNKNLPTYKQIKKVELRKTEFEKTTSKKIKRHLVK